MGDLTRIGLGVLWGPAEQAAIDRCLTVPGLSAARVRRFPAARLSRTIETEIIPRLMLAHQAEPEEKAGSQPRLTPADVREFTRLVLEHDVDPVMGHVESIMSRGHAVQAVLLDLLGPTARLLGDMWQDDLCSFAEVTIGLSRLQQVLRRLSHGFEHETQPEVRGRILLAAVPGEQHSFGISMLESFFRRAGWDVWGGAVHSRAELLQFARDEWLDVIGLSLSSDVLYGQLSPLVHKMRKVSRNPSIFVMVGGRYFVDNPDQAAAVGADMAAADAPDALRRASACLSFALAGC